MEMWKYVLYYSNVSIIIYLQGVFAFYIYSYEPVRYPGYEYPEWAGYLGLAIAFSSMIWGPLYAIYFFVFVATGSYKPA